MKTMITQLRERITFLIPLEKDDGMGGQIISWAKKWTVWADIRGGISPSVGEGRSILYHIRVRPGIPIHHSMRLKWKEKILKITHEPILGKDRKGLELRAVEVKLKRSKK